MSVILFEKDPFIDAVTNHPELGFASENVRRPLYGTASKDARYAFISIQQINSEGQLSPISLVDSSAPGGYSTASHNFILQQLSFQRQEKTQIIETFGDHFAFFYGERPIIVPVAGLLINTRDFNWKNEWMRNYEKYLRGTKCVEYRARAYLGYDDMLLEGYILGTEVSEEKDFPNVCPFSFQMLLTNYVDMSYMNELVIEANQARRLGEDAKMPRALVEYLEDPRGGSYWEVNAVTGYSEPVSGLSEDVPKSISDSGTNQRTAFWISGGDTARRQWLSENQALVAVAVQAYAQQQEMDPVMALQQLRASPGTFPLATLSSDSPNLAKALSTGVANMAVKL